MKKTAEISIILGKRGCGKSTLAKELLRKTPFNRVIVVDTLGEHAKGRKVVRTVPELLAAVRGKQFNLAVQFTDAQDGFVWACKAAYAAQDLMLFCEEVDFYIKANYAPEAFSVLVRYGRHKGVAMMCISRRPPDLWRNLTANADSLYIFQTTEPRDIRYLSEFMGGEAERLKGLGKLEYLCYRNGETTNGRTRF